MGSTPTTPVPSGQVNQESLLRLPSSSTASPSSPLSPLSPMLSPVSSSADMCSLNRLSLRHGASPDDIGSYVCQMGTVLRDALATGGAAEQGVYSWAPCAPRLEECYRIDRELGRGHSGVVYECQDVVTREVFACKSIAKAAIQKEEDVDELCGEILTMLQLHSWRGLQREDSVVHLHEVIDEPCYVHIIMDLCPGGDLFQCVSHRKRLSEGEAAHVLRQLVRSVLHLHSLGIVHRDLKPENVFLTSSTQSTLGVKLGDFGLCVQLRNGQRIKGAAGSPFYISPEVVAGRAYSGEVDVWSLGVILYTCLAGYLPFWRDSREALYEAILKARPNLRKHPWQNVSAAAKDLIRGMLSPDPLRRLWLQDVLEHPWMLHNYGN